MKNSTNKTLSFVEAIYLLAPLVILGLGLYLIFFTATSGGGWLIFLAMIMYPSFRSKINSDGTSEKEIDS